MRELLGALALTAGLLAGLPAAAGIITTPEIIAAGASPLCLDYQVVGFCVWLDCTPFGCDVSVTPKICHYLPDAVASSYHRSGENPWVEMSGVSAAARAAGTGLLSSLMGSVGILLDGGVRTEGDGAREDKGMPFKEVSVIGSPAAAAMSAGSAHFLCPSVAVPFEPYLLTELDAFPWRTGLTELIYPETFIPGLREIGLWPLNTWGSVHPRIGSVIQTEDPKAAAVTAQRGADIVTRPGQPHVYVPMAGLPSDEHTDRWQMLTPLPLPFCETFGSPDPLWSTGKVAEDGGYAWHYWRRYQCCIPGPGVLIHEEGLCPNALFVF